MNEIGSFILEKLNKDYLNNLKIKIYKKRQAFCEILITKYDYRIGQPHIDLVYNIYNSTSWFDAIDDYKKLIDSTVLLIEDRKKFSYLYILIHEYKEIYKHLTLLTSQQSP